MTSAEATQRFEIRGVQYTSNQAHIPKKSSHPWITYFVDTNKPICDLNSIVCVCDRFVTPRKEAVSWIILSDERANTRSVRFRNSLRWPIYIISSVEKIKLSYSQVSQVIVLSGAILMKLFVKKNHETRSSNMFHTKHQIVGGLGGLKTPFPFPPPPPLDHLPLVLVYHSVLVFLHLLTLPKRIKNGWWIKSQWYFSAETIKNTPYNLYQSKNALKCEYRENQN